MRIMSRGTGERFTKNFPVIQAQLRDGTRVKVWYADVGDNKRFFLQTDYDEGELASDADPIFDLNDNPIPDTLPKDKKRAKGPEVFWRNLRDGGNVYKDKVTVFK